MSPRAEPTTDRRASVDRLYVLLFPEPDEVLTDEQARARVLNQEAVHADAEPEALRAAGFSSLQQGRFRVAQRVVRDYLAQPAFHPQLAGALSAHREGLLAAALDAPGWIEQRGHPVNDLLQALGELAPGWCPEHPQADDLRQRMVSWLQALGDGSAAKELAEEAWSWLERFHQRVDKLGERLRQAEEGAMRLEYARRQAAAVIQRQLAGRLLPDFLARDLVDHWWPALEWVLLNRGEDSVLWDQAVRVLTLLFWSLQPEQAQEQNQRKLKRVSGDLHGQLRALLEEVVADEAARSRMLDDIQVAHTALLNGRELNFVEVTEPASGSVVEDAGTAISEDLLREMQGLSTRDWFEVRATGERMRLLIRRDDYQQLLFVNQAGLKTRTTSFEDFAWRLTNREVVQVPRAAAPRELVVEHLEELARYYRQQQQQQQQKEKAGAQATDSGVEPDTTPAEEPGEAPAAHPQPDEQASPGAHADAEASAPSGTPDTEAPAAEEPLPEADTSDGQGERKRARLLVSGLPLGTWMQFREDDGSWTRLKLILVMSSSDKYVFVSRNGLDRREIRRRDLIDGIANGAISVFSSDSRYDDTLSRVVGGLQQNNKAG